MCEASGQIGVAARVELAWQAINLQFEFACEYIKETLGGCAVKVAAGFELGRVLRKSRAHCRTRMDNRRAGLHARQSSADKSVRRQKHMILFLHAARFTEFMHGTSFFETQRKRQAVRAKQIHIRWPSLRLPS